MKKAVNWEVGSTWYADNFDSGKTSGKLTDAFENENKITFLSTCRSAISLILSHIKVGSGRRALVPSFTCHSVIRPFTAAGYKVQCYPLTENLEIDLDGLSALVDNFRPDVILIHAYFGFDTVSKASEYLACCRDRGIIVIEDMTQTMFSCLKHLEADYAIGSIRKWMPVPDGAFLGGLEIKELREDKELAKAKICAMQAKHDYIFHGIGKKEEFMTKFSTAEHMLDSRAEPYAISQFTLSSLRSLDIREFGDCRRNNFNYLATRLSSHPELSVIFPKASCDDVPFLLPLYIREKRKDFQAYMAKHNVYPTIIWSCPGELEKLINPVTRKIYNHILCFHVDQRYNMDDMDKVADIIDSYFER